MTLAAEIDDFLEPILQSFRGQLQANVQGHTAGMYLAGSAQMTSYGRTLQRDLPIYYEGAPIQDAVNYASQHCAKLVTQMDDKTKQILADVISEGIENKRGIPGLKSDIYNAIEDMSRDRAELIARTESCDALEQAFMDRAGAMGVTGKRWIATDPCEVCQACADEGDVPIDFEYPHDGIDSTRPPAHPNCRCALAPVMLPQAELPEGDVSKSLSDYLTNNDRRDLAKLGDQALKQMIQSPDWSGNVKDVYAFGSFVSTKVAPADLDLYVVAKAGSQGRLQVLADEITKFASGQIKGKSVGILVNPEFLAYDTGGRSGSLAWTAKSMLKKYGTEPIKLAIRR